ncbi:hypothetical protein ANCCAN_09769 [Ancylostoma caninum]|uniref:Uncharacterized protein n=1 Tax=Ancylostoma caninum TaxID=29170 RepID=A0A368GIP1_ANCCA|nr:hypothetical protein ANCCAN_09769 [Ancylostoma caninum]
MTTVFKDYTETISAPSMYHHSMGLEGDQNVAVSEMIMTDPQDINVNSDDNGFASPIKPAPFYTTPTDAMYYTNNFKDYGWLELWFLRFSTAEFVLSLISFLEEYVRDSQFSSNHLC